MRKERIPSHGHTGDGDGGRLRLSGAVVGWGGSSSGGTGVAGGSGGGSTDHGSLGGLGDDDHPQYVEETDDITARPTAETDTDLRLAPDGAGGVEWATTGGGSFSGDAGDVPADSTGYGNSSGTDVQAILDDFDDAISAGGSGGGGGLPAIAATSGGNRTSDNTSHTANLPSGITAGDLLIMVLGFDGNPTVTWPMGWTSIHAGAAASNQAYLAIAYRVADGSEGSSIAITTSASEMFAYTGMLIRNYSGAPESSTGSTGSSAQMDPDQWLPSWGADGHTLWLECAAYDGGTRWTTDWPYSLIRGGGYGSGNSNPNQRADNGSGCGVGIVGSYAPIPPPAGGGAFTLSTAEEWRCCMVAVQGD